MSTVPCIDWSKAPEGTTHAYISSFSWNDDGTPSTPICWEKHIKGEAFNMTYGGGWSYLGKVSGICGKLRIEKPQAEISTAIVIDWNKAPEGTTHAEIMMPSQWKDGEPNSSDCWERHTDEGKYFYDDIGCSWERFSISASEGLACRVANPNIEVSKCEI